MVNISHRQVFNRSFIGNSNNKLLNSPDAVLSAAEESHGRPIPFRSEAGLFKALLHPLSCLFQQGPEGRHQLQNKMQPSPTSAASLGSNGWLRLAGPQKAATA